MKLKLAWTTLAIVPLVPHALAQTQVRHIDALSGTGSPNPTFSAVRAVPNGGALAVVNGNAIRRVDADGTPLWSVDPADLTSIRDLVVAAGDQAVAVGLGTFNPMAQTTAVTRLDGNGSTVWSTLLPPLPGVVPAVELSVAAESPNTVFIGNGPLRDPFNPLAGVPSVQGLDASSGALLWQRDILDAFEFEVPRFDGAGDDYFTAYVDVNRELVVERFDSNGQTVYRVDSAQTTPIAPRVLDVLARSDGGVYVLGRNPQTSVSPEGVVVITIDPAGNVQGEVAVAAPGSGGTQGFGALTKSEDLVVVTRVAGGRILRVDEAGNLLWDVPGPAGTLTYSTVVASRDDSALVHALVPAPGSVPYQSRLVRVDASGATLESIQLGQGPSGALPGAVDLGTPDASGRQYVGITYGLLGDELLYPALLELIADPLVEANVCTASSPNSTGATGGLAAIGSPLAATNDIALVASDLPPGQFVLFLNSRTTGFTPNPGGSLGDLCLGGTINRYVAPGEIRAANIFGRASLQLDLTATPDGAALVAALAGETWNFQAWHRDVDQGMPTSNLTGAVAVTLQ